MKQHVFSFAGLGLGMRLGSALVLVALIWLVIYVTVH
jgi:hypothetical protein